MSETAANAWTRCRPWLEGALRRHGEGCIEDVRHEIESGRAWFWPAQESAAVLQLAKECNVWLAGGELQDVLAELPKVEAWARSQDCDRMALRGRRGWERVLGPRGYRPVHMLVKGL